MKMPGRIEMSAVVGRELDLLHRPALTIGQIRCRQSFEKLQHARQAPLVIAVVNRRM
jgi:hypothetical protein